MAPDGVLAISHIHNLDYAGGAKGPAKRADEWRTLFADATVYDERMLLDALMRRTAPRPVGWVAEKGIEAWSLVERQGDDPAREVDGGLAMPLPGALLRPNPLLGPHGATWPSDRYRDEYREGCLWAQSDADVPTTDAARLRRLVDLPERW